MTRLAAATVAAALLTACGGAGAEDVGAAYMDREFSGVPDDPPRFETVWSRHLDDGTVIVLTADTDPEDGTLAALLEVEDDGDGWEVTQKHHDTERAQAVVECLRAGRDEQRCVAVLPIEDLQ